MIRERETKILLRSKHFIQIDVEWGIHTFTTDGHMMASKEMIDQLGGNRMIVLRRLIFRLLNRDHDRWMNTIMDIIPIPTKVLGKLGEGITHTITGVYVMLTGVDGTGKQYTNLVHQEGNLKEMVS